MLTIWFPQSLKRLPMRLSTVVLLQEEFNSRHDHIFTLSPDLKNELSHSKTVTAAFHFNKREAKPELKP